MNLSQAFTQIGQWFAALAQQVLPAGGTTGQVLTKVDGTDWNVDWETPSGGGGLSILALGVDGASSSYVTETSFALYSGGTSITLQRNGLPNGYNLLRALETVVVVADSSTGLLGIPINSDVSVVLHNTAENILFNAVAGQAINKSVKYIQLGTGQIKIDGTPLFCPGNPITNTAGSALDVMNVNAGAVFACTVAGDLAAADVGPYYTGLDENTTSGLTYSGCLADNGGIKSVGASILSARTRDPIPYDRTYVELDVNLLSGTFGFAKPGFAGAEMGLDTDSMAIRVSADTNDLEIWHNGAAIATLPGVGFWGAGSARFGLLIDRTTSEFWIAAGNAWLVLDPSVDPGLPYFPGGDGGGDAWLALESRPGSTQYTRLFFLPSTIFFSALATGGGAVQIGWLHP